MYPKNRMMAQPVNYLPRFDGMAMPIIVSPACSESSLDGLQEEKAKLERISLEPKSKPLHLPYHQHQLHQPSIKNSNGRLNKFVRRLHEMLTVERHGGVVEWRRGLLVLHSISTFSKEVLPKYFNTRNFKTFRRQLNYYGFLHVRSFSASGSATTALWVHKQLADHGTDSISSVLKLKRVEPDGASKTPEERRERKNEASNSAKVQGFSVAGYPATNDMVGITRSSSVSSSIPKFVHCQRQEEPSQVLNEYASTQDTTLKNLNESMEQMAAGLLLSLSHAAA
mmetsp:Transcript_37867/g.81755  ORF Transcript_37867/g.81755 Transcript_37867/m.81755 type:complete len:282 (-) Transcript_37867:237-1082(-)